MSQSYVTVDKVVNDYTMSIDADDYGSNGEPSGVYHRPKWMSVSLDLFGLHEM